MCDRYAPFVHTRCSEKSLVIGALLELAWLGCELRAICIIRTHGSVVRPPGIWVIFYALVNTVRQIRERVASDCALVVLAQAVR